ncbi:hypothetical protein DXG01_010670 [Tephrocybe rancida]|nr:hypothetical protein DXG01_010670 [Tephrocybe rancida]
MGNFTSTAHHAHFSGKNTQALQRKCGLLVLGSSVLTFLAAFSHPLRPPSVGAVGSGKSTIVKQMKIHHCGYSPQELLEHRCVIYQNLLEAAQAVVYRLDHGHATAEHRALADTVLAYRVEGLNEFDQDITKAIHKLWIGMPKLRIFIGIEPRLVESASYFFDEILRIGAPGYQPTDADILHARSKNSRPLETTVKMDLCIDAQLSSRVRMLEVSPPQPRELAQHFVGISIIVLCVDLSGYDDVQLCKGSQNQLKESLQLFQSLVDFRWKKPVAVVLLFNKIDLLNRKLPRVPLEQFFPGYTGGAKVGEAVRYIMQWFIQTKRPKLTIYSHVSQGTQTDNVEFVSTTINQIMLQNGGRG